MLHYSIYLEASDDKNSSNEHLGMVATQYEKKIGDFFEMDGVRYKIVGAKVQLDSDSIYDNTFIVAVAPNRTRAMLDQ